VKQANVPKSVAICRPYIQLVVKLGGHSWVVIALDERQRDTLGHRANQRFQLCEFFTLRGRDSMREVTDHDYPIGFNPRHQTEEPVTTTAGARLQFDSTFVSQGALKSSVDVCDHQRALTSG
jgi:hypothetical protein